jgi:peptidoglycan hydrolase CwlO-like protein
MKLTLFLIPLILLSSCTIDWNDEKDKQIVELENQVQEKERRINDIKNTVDDCNSNISDAQGYAGETYEEMNDALENLQECDI